MAAARPYRRPKPGCVARSGTSFPFHPLIMPQPASGIETRPIFRRASALDRAIRGTSARPARFRHPSRVEVVTAGRALARSRPGAPPRSSQRTQHTREEGKCGAGGRFASPLTHTTHKARRLNVSARIRLISCEGLTQAAVTYALGTHTSCPEGTRFGRTFSRGAVHTQAALGRKSPGSTR